MTARPNRLRQQCWDLGITLPADAELDFRHQSDRAEVLRGVEDDLGIDKRQGAYLIREDDGTPYALLTYPAFRLARHAMAPAEYGRAPRDRDLREWTPRSALPGHARFAAPQPRPIAPAEPASDEPASDADEPAQARYVTIDATVLLHGIRAELFEPGDRIVASVAADIDRGGYSYEEAKGRLPASTGRASKGISRGVPLPIDGRVMDAYRHLSWAWLEAPEDKRNALSTGDLLCLAVAAAHSLPLYTTRPGAYRPLRSGVEFIKYGPIRDGSRVEFEEPTGGRKPALRREPAPITDPVEAAAALEKAFLDGTAPHDDAIVWRLKMAQDVDAWTRVVLRILQDSAEDLAWRIFILEYPMPATSAAHASPLREDLLLEISSLASGTMDRSSPDRMRANRAALRAYAEWGEWNPEFEAVLDLLDEGDDIALAWYPTMLRLKGVDFETSEQELVRVHRGKPVSRARFDEIVAKAAAQG